MTGVQTCALPIYPGLFAGVVAARAPYRLRATGSGAVWAFDDPFRFGPVIGELDEYLLGEGRQKRLWHSLGAHIITHEGVEGTHFAVWAPNAERVSVVGDFNIWDGRRHPMRRRGGTGVWETFVPGMGEGTIYKYEIRGQGGQILPLKADPVGFGSEHPNPTGRWCARSTIRTGRMPTGWRRAGRCSMWMRRSRFTRCIWAAGKKPKAARGPFRMTSWRLIWWTMWPGWGSAISS